MKRLLSVCAFSLCASSTMAISQGSPFCPADLTNDYILDFFDVSTFIDGFAKHDPIADFTDDGIYDFYDISEFLDQFTGDCPDLTDTDGDRIPDFAETNTGIYINALNTGSDPLNPDTDGDGLSDGDEVLGTVDGLILVDASPNFRDLYIECDWFEGNFQGRDENYRPTAAAVQRVVECFLDAPTPNPYGHPDGINIHLDYGQGDGFTGGNRIEGAPVYILWDTEFNEYKANNFDPKRKGYFHYAIFANRYQSATNRSSGVAEINGDDFMVTMVDYQSNNGMANTIVHELGHNLGLRHGGFENRNRKPNYNSVMNYRHQFPGVDVTGSSLGNGVLDYSRGTNRDLNELALIEADGVDGSNPIDWNRNGVIEVDPYAANINCNSTSWWQNCGEGISCYDDDCDVLEDHNDWANINWNRLRESADRRAPAEISVCDNWPGKE